MVYFYLTAHTLGCYEVLTNHLQNIIAPTKSNGKLSNYGARAVFIQ